jgi:hypothetical protein
MQAYHHFLATAELTFGLSVSDTAWTERGPDDPPGLFLARDRDKAFIFRPGKRLLKDHGDQVFLHAALDAVNLHGHQKHSNALLLE